MTYLEHHGILGQKWGVRRFQNEDGSLTEAGKKRYDKINKKAERMYQKEMIKYQKDSLRNRRQLNLNAYNKTADEYNQYKIEEFNKTNSVNDPDYASKYAKQFEHDYRQNFDKMRLSEMENNKHYKKAQSIVQKYEGISTSDIVIKNKAFVNDLKDALNSGKTSWDLDLSKYKS